MVTKKCRSQNIALTNTCKHRLRELSRRLLVRQLSRCMVPGAASAELVRPGAGRAQLAAKDLTDALHTSNLDGVIIIKYMAPFMSSEIIKHSSNR